MAVTMVAAFTRLRSMRVLVVLIVGVFVFMLQNLMQVLMGMVLGEVQPYAQAHQPRSNPECQRSHFRKNKQRHCRTDKRCG